ncbi:MAG: arabinogalactan endo-1,4-beta-galactosidase, partial [Ureaplasma sp.]|nr:arabinogalactan endo-1,4-beta-galactosidase [Ureaplasma sp.]
VIKKIDYILLSSYIVWGSTFNNEYESIKAIKENYPNKKIILGEVAVHYNSLESEYINEATKNINDVNWNPEFQALITHQYMQFLSKLFPDKETGMYWWEIGQLYIGKLSWASNEGINFYKAIDSHKKWKDVNNWSQMNCFDNNAIALPSLDAISNFERNIESNDYNHFSPIEYFGFNTNSYNEKIKMFYEQIKFSWPNFFIKLDLNKIIYDKNNISINDKDIDVEIYLNEENVSQEELKNKVINKVKNEFRSLMYSQITFKDFKYDLKTNIGSITLSSNENSFYYKNFAELKFKVYNEYLTNTIDLTSRNIKIAKNDKQWYLKIINELKSQPNYAFGDQIWKYLNISGGGTDDNNIWLYDENKSVNRDAEFFLLKNDQIRMSTNKVDNDILNNNKIWIDDFSKYDFVGNNTIYFAIRKGINDINLEYNIPSTFSQVGKESWKYIDLLVYKYRTLPVLCRQLKI